MQVGCSAQLLLLGSRLVAAISLALLLSLLLLLPPCLAPANLQVEACLALLSLLPPQVSPRPMAFGLNQQERSPEYSADYCCSAAGLAIAVHLHVHVRLPDLAFISAFCDLCQSVHAACTAMLP
jgi:hypothetical protein